MKVEISAPIEFQGSVVGQVNQRRGVILETVSDENVTVTCEVPLNAMFGYSTDLRSATQARATSPWSSLVTRRFRSKSKKR